MSLETSSIGKRKFHDFGVDDHAHKRMRADKGDGSASSSEEVEEIEEKVSGAVSKTLIEKAQEDFASRDVRLAQRVLMADGPLSLARRTVTDQTISRLFDERVKNLGKVTDQKSSGRCWMFAGFNLLRGSVIDKYNLENFEFSKTYLYFWDKFEKSNAFLSRIIDTADDDIQDNDVQALIGSPCPDGAWWESFANLIEKYGAIPESAMEETYNTKRSTRMNDYLKDLLRNYACELRSMASDGADDADLQARREEMMTDVYRVLAMNLGEPPKTFDWIYKDKDKKIHRITNLDAKSFLEEHVPAKIDDMVSLMHAPLINDPREYKRYEVEGETNVIDGKEVGFIGVPQDVLWKAAMDQVQAGEPVWFACDVSRDRERSSGKMSRSLYDYEAIYDIPIEMTKAEKLEYGVSESNHAMVLTAVQVENGRPVKWEILNSWGKDSGDDGYLVMDHDWFENYVFNVIVDKKYLSRRVARLVDSEPIVLHHDDPLCRSNHDHDCGEDHDH